MTASGGTAGGTYGKIAEYTPDTMDTAGTMDATDETDTQADNTTTLAAPPS